MPKMIKITLSRPSTDVNWGIADEMGLSDELMTSYNLMRSKINYDAATPGSYTSQSVFNSPDDLHMERYYLFNDYPSNNGGTTPANLAQWFWKARRAADSEHIGDVTVNSTNPLTNEAMSYKYNKFQEWMRNWRASNGIKPISYEEVDHTFPTE